MNKKVVEIFTCGPSVYQRSHIGNFRTFMFEDLLVRYLLYLGHNVNRGMNFTDVEDKALEEAEKKGMGLGDLADDNIRNFLAEMDLLRMKIPDYLPRASEHVDQAVEIIEQLLDRGIAYWHRGNVYFDPLRFPGFGEIYGLDMSRWPARKKRFHKDTYPGTRWNLGDFILWHGEKKAGRVRWETRIGKGRPSWNIQDASIMFKHVHETLSVYCGGFDNVFRHHDYTRAILESVRPYPMARFWLHGGLLLVGGQKMSKSRGNIVYTDRVLDQGFTVEDLRFFLLCHPYREKLDYSNERMRAAAEKLYKFKLRVKEIGVRGNHRPADEESARKVRAIFTGKMNEDLNMGEAFVELYEFFSKIDPDRLDPHVASGYGRAIKEIDQVLKVM